MVENQNLVPNLNEMMNEYVHGEEKVYLEPQPGIVITEEPEAQPEARELMRKKGKQKDRDQ